MSRSLHCLNMYTKFVFKKVDFPFKQLPKSNRSHDQINTVKLGDKERFDKEQIGVKEPFPVTK